MPVPDLVRDAFVGQLIYHASGKRCFRHREERPDFVVPAQYTTSRPASRSDGGSENATLDGGPSSPPKDEQKAESSKEKGGDVIVSEREDNERDTEDKEKRQKAGDVEVGTARVEGEGADTIIVDWYGPDDPDCPFNVSSREPREKAC